MKVAIVGAGIAGPTLAHWLNRYGYEPTLIEKAPRLRTGGYVVDFWGGGYQVAERMGLTDELHDAGYTVEEVRLVAGDGRRLGGFSTEVFNRTMARRFVSVPRGDLAAMIYRSIETDVETIFGQDVSEIHQDESGVQVTMEHGQTRNFDLVVGAGGIHCPVRNLAFGPQPEFERDLGYRVAVFEATGYSRRDDVVYLAYTTPGRMVTRFSMREDRTMFMFVFAREQMPASDPTELGEAKQILRCVFENAGWECPEILTHLNAAPDLYFDRVSQIRMDRWAIGRVALVGDAAAAVSLLAGEGAGLAMVEAYVLAGELARAGGDYGPAFRRYEQTLRPIVDARQRSARVFASLFTPKTPLGMWLRNKLSNLLNAPLAADWIVGREFADDVHLPDYGSMNLNR